MTAYAADMTKLLSADSFVSAHVHPLAPKPPPADPGAPLDFIDVVDLITNGVDLYLKVPGSLPRPAGPLQSAWTTVAASCCGSEPARHVAVGAPSPSVAEDAAAASVSFSDFLTEAGVSERLAAWVAFQVSEPSLQELFWANNTEEDLATAQDAFFSTVGAQSASIFSRRRAVTMSLGYAADHVSHTVWSPSDFAFAYAFWAYVKGMRYARELDDTNVYAVHWLRLRAVTDTDNATEIALNRSHIPVPWGYLLRSLLEERPDACHAASLSRQLLDLRRFTIEQLPLATTARQRSRFLVDGLIQTSETLGQHSQRTRLFDEIAELGETVAPIAGPVGAMGAFMLRWLRRRVPHSEQERNAGLLISMNSPMVRRFILTGHR